MSIQTIPSFSRVEIRARCKYEIKAAAAELRKLAEELDRVEQDSTDDDTAAVLAHHKIKAVSQKLRGSA
jgi:hypothetical protein